MSVELIKKPITLDEMTKKESVQVVKERDMIVPDGKPDMQRILQIDGRIEIDQLDVNQDRVAYKGKIDVIILYSGDTNPSAVYMMRNAIPLEDFIMLEGIDKDQKVDFDYTIEHLSYNVLNERKVNVRSILQLDVAATKSKETNIITGLDTKDPVQTCTKPIEVITLGDDKEERMIVKEDLAIMQSKPSMGEILKTNINIVEDQIKRTENEVLYNGILEVGTLYKATGEESIEMITHRVPFSGSIEVEQLPEEAYWDCMLSAKPSYMQIAPDYDGEDRVIEAEIIVSARYTCFYKTIEETVNDLYCPGKKVAMKEKTLDYMNLVNRTQVTTPKKQSIVLENLSPENSEIFSIQIRPLVEEKQLENNMLTLKGMLEIKTTYINHQEGPPVECVMNLVPFSQDMEVIAINKKPFICPRIIVKDIKLYSQNRKEIVVEYVLDSIVDIYAKEALNVLEEINLEDMSKEELATYPSMTIYQVKKGDTLWGLAKKFNTTINDIKEVNGTDFNEVLNQGEKIIILKKIY